MLRGHNVIYYLYIHIYSSIYTQTRHGSRVEGLYRGGGGWRRENRHVRGSYAYVITSRDPCVTSAARGYRETLLRGDLFPCGGPVRWNNVFLRTGSGAACEGTKPLSAYLAARVTCTSYKGSRCARACARRSPPAASPPARIDDRVRQFGEITFRPRVFSTFEIMIITIITTMCTR